MDSASEGEGLCMSYVGVGVWSVLLSYFCKSIAFWASPRLAHRSVGLVHFDWGRLDFGLQATSCGGGWVCSMSFSSSLDQQLSSLLFKCQMAGMQDSKWKQVTPGEFLTLNSHSVSYTHNSFASCRVKLCWMQQNRNSELHCKSHRCIELYYA